MNILMLAACPFPTPQGSQVFIRHLATALATAGHAVHLVTYGAGDTTALPFEVYRARHPDIGTRSGPSWRKPLADAALLATAHVVLRRTATQVLHAHNIEGLAVGALLRAATGLPLVYHCHNAMAAELPTYFHRRALRLAARWAGKFADLTLPRAADAVITFDREHQALHRAHGLHPQRLHVIAAGLDLHELAPFTEDRPRATPGADAGPQVLYAGNPDGYQNLELLWRGFARLRAQLPGVRLRVVSHHPAAAFGLPRPGVEMQGFADLAALRRLYAQARLGVCTRVLSTGVPIKVLNYRAAGLPVVACRSAARHLVPPSAGLLVDPHPDALAKAMRTLLQGPPLQTVTRGLQQFDIAAQVPLYEAVYEAALGVRSMARARCTST